MTEIGVIRTGAANVASVFAGFQRLDCRCRLIDTPTDLANAGIVVIPGVGTFGQAMTGLCGRNLVDSLQKHTEQGRPILGICLGFQVLFESSDESPGIRGIGILPGNVRRMSATTLPQIGWNRVEGSSCRLQRSGHFYFANSYAVPLDVFEGWSVSRYEYDGAYVAGIERGPQLGCQFHPELSGELGLEVLRCWLSEARQ